MLGADALPITAFAAHRSAFERRWCDTLTAGQPWICTHKSALRVWPDAPSHSNQTLRYWRRPAGLERDRANPAHRAAPDAYVSAHLLRDMLDAASLAELLAWSAEPALFVRVPYGPERGRRFDSLDDDTLERLSASRDLEIAFSARQWRARRAGTSPDVTPPHEISRQERLEF